MQHTRHLPGESASQHTTPTCIALCLPNMLAPKVNRVAIKLLQPKLSLRSLKHIEFGHLLEDEKKTSHAENVQGQGCKLNRRAYDLPSPINSRASVQTSTSGDYASRCEIIPVLPQRGIGTVPTPQGHPPSHVSGPWTHAAPAEVMKPDREPRAVGEVLPTSWSAAIGAGSSGGGGGTDGRVHLIRFSSLTLTSRLLLLLELLAAWRNTSKRCRAASQPWTVPKHPLNSGSFASPTILTSAPTSSDGTSATEHSLVEDSLVVDSSSLSQWCLHSTAGAE